MTQPQPTWTPPPTPSTDAGMGSLNPAVRDIPTYVPPSIPPADNISRPSSRTIPDRWIHLPTVRPLLTYIMLAIIVSLFVLTTYVPQVGEALFQFGRLSKLQVLNGEWWRLITAAFLHGGLPVFALNVLHIAFNGYALYLIGMEIEAFFGRLRFLAIYFISALAGSVASFIFLPIFASSVGASGAIFGLIGALAVYFGFNRYLFGKRGQAQFWNILFVIALNLGIGFSGILPVDNSAHLGGLIAGAAVGFVLCPRYRFGSWRNPLVREIDNFNTGPLPWIAATLVALTVVAIFLAALTYFRLY